MIIHDLYDYFYAFDKVDWTTKKYCTEDFNKNKKNRNILKIQMVPMQWKLMELPIKKNLKIIM
jgi:hypothetical protein